VVAGIETKEQPEHLRSIGCRMGQGHQFAKPMPADELSAMLRSAHRRDAADLAVRSA
jgi:EAL domain-containing protein (putative c-di-GMP-specific phosphodiesterase class I)